MIFRAIFPAAKARLFLTALPALVLALLPASGRSADLESWTDARFAARWTDDFTFFAAPGLRTDNISGELARLSIQAGFDMRVNERFTFSPSYQLITGEPDYGIRSNEHRFGLGAYTAGELGEFSLRGGMRIEYSHREGDDGTWRLRPSLTVQHALGPDSWRLRGYATVEGFVEAGPGGWARTRVFFGLRKPLNERCSLDLFFGHERDHTGDDTDANIVGNSLRYLFDRRQTRRPLVEGLLDSPE